jgi:hypothetical protein
MLDGLRPDADKIGMRRKLLFYLSRRPLVVGRWATDSRDRLLWTIAMHDLDTISRLTQPFADVLRDHY